MKMSYLLFCLSYVAIIIGHEDQNINNEYIRIGQDVLTTIYRGDRHSTEALGKKLVEFIANKKIEYDAQGAPLAYVLERIIPIIEASQNIELKKDFNETLNQIITQFKQAKEVEGYSLQAVIFMNQKNYKAALKEINDGLKLAHINQSYKKPFFLNVKGKIEEKLKKYAAAYHDYQEIGNIPNMLSLILTNEYSIKDDAKAKLFNDLKTVADLYPASGVALAYSFLIIGQGNLDDGIIRILKNIKNDVAIEPLAALQLGLASYYGLGMDQNIENARKYFAIAESPLVFSSNVAKGCRLFYGIDKEKDERKALSYFNDQSLFDDLFLPVTLLFPDIAKALEENEERIRERAIEALLQQEEKKELIKKKKSNPKKRDAQIEQPSSSTYAGEKQEESVELQSLLQKNSGGAIDWKKILGNPETWNKWFMVNDDSNVSAIDYNQHTITIDDSKHNEQLKFYISIDPNKKRRFIPPFTYHKRIALRQDLSQSDVNQKTAYDHSFAQMLDYVIQQFGTLVPLLKAGNAIDDQLTATVVRIDEKGNEKLCRAEYTFGEKNGEVYVYHRLLRPAKNRNISHELALPSSNNLPID